MKQKNDDCDFKNSPVAWFCQMDFAARDGNFEQAAYAKRELERLGVFVRFKGKVQKQYRKAEQKLAARKPKLLEILVG